MKHLFNFSPIVKINIDKSIIIDFYNYCLKENININKAFTDDCSFTVYVSILNFIKIKPKFKNYINYYEYLGFIYKTFRFLFRPGIALAFISSLVLFLFIQTRIYKIKIVGNSQIDSDVIYNRLQTLSVTQGIRKNIMLTDTLADSLLKISPELSFVSVKQKGITLEVSVIEKEVSEIMKQSGINNIVSKEDALIEKINVISGKAEVVKGETVKKGDILIGYYKDGQNSSYIRPAEGEVIGTVNRVFTVEIPLQYSKKTYDTIITLNKNVNICGFYINILNNCGNFDSDYDIIEYKYDIKLLFIELPVTINSQCAKTYHKTSVTLNENEAVRSAFSLLNSEISSKLSDSMILQKTTYGYFTDNSFVLSCEVICQEDITQNQEVKLN